MFQSFEPLSDRSYAKKHLPLLRAEMKKQKLDGFIIPHDDEYQNEYTPAYAERLMWISGFSGSAGAAIVFAESAVMFTDGRYTLQVRQQTDSDYFDYVDISETAPSEWLKQHAKKGAKIGYDPMLHTMAGVKKMTDAAEAAGFSLIATDENPVDAAWSDQPARPAAPAYAHDLSFAGKASSEKRNDIAKTVKSLGADAALITAPPSVAWLFNIRGGDVARSPLPLSRAILETSGKAVLFINPAKVNSELAGILGDDVDIRAESDIVEALAALGARNARVCVDPALTPAKYGANLRAAGAHIIETRDPCALPRAIKNKTEIDGARAAHIRDGAAVSAFLHWLDTEAQTGAIDEITAAQKLEAFRAQSNELCDLSFDTISGAGAHGAVVHYRVTTRSNKKLESGELYLVDSGAQYRDGTTDITRTVPIGQPSDEMRERFTRVLKGHIALASAKFPKGTTGHQLDALARTPLWEIGIDYDHGTGHGVGSFLGVHEGPQRIAKAANDEALHPGMIISNEPGYYKAGEYGIRIENLIVVREAQTLKDGDRSMLSFETITLAPIHISLVKPELLSPAERQWLNDYHARVRETLTPHIPAAIRPWFETATRAI